MFIPCSWFHILSWYIWFFFLIFFVRISQSLSLWSTRKNWIATIYFHLIACRLQSRIFLKTAVFVSLIFFFQLQDYKTVCYSWFVFRFDFTGLKYFTDVHFLFDWRIERTFSLSYDNFMFLIVLIDRLFLPLKLTALIHL